MELKIKIHSFIDVITNSSTEIYIMNKNKLKENIEDIIESLTFLADTDVDFRDIFEIAISSDGDGIKIYSKEDMWKGYLEDKDYYKKDEWEKIEKKFQFYLKNPEKGKKIVKSLEAIFGNLECVDY